MSKPPEMSRNCSFDFDLASTSLSEAISRDLNFPLQKYGKKDDCFINKMRTMFAKNQSLCTLKKYTEQTDSGEEDEKEQKTFKKFFDVNDHIDKFNDGRFRSPELSRRVNKSISSRSRVLIRARAIVKSLLTPFSQDEWDMQCKNSKGSSIGVPYVDTSDERKFQYPISGTHSAISLFEYNLQGDERLSSAIHDMNSTNAVKHKFDYINGSRATTVPKDSAFRRMIAIEPTANMYLQQGLMRMMYDRMDKKSLDVSSLPEEHTHLAKEASITGVNATIDFSSASDCTSIELARFLLPPQWFMVVMSTRSPTLSFDGEEVELSMISTMGNAVTFPLETIFFWSLGQASVLEQKGTNTTLLEEQCLRDVSVFGDDCIIPCSAVSIFMDICTYVGYLVNAVKSHFTEKPGFRESCGGDYYRGVDMRALYIKAPVSTRKSAAEPWLYILLNKVLSKYISYFGSVSYLYDKAVITAIFDMFKLLDITVKVVPSNFPLDSGVIDNGDLRRLFAAYSAKLGVLRQDEHGSIRFNFCSFRYKESITKIDSLRYAIWLKRPSCSQLSIKSKRKCVTILASGSKLPKRLRGNYVVGVSVSSHWTPSLSS